ncbi:MAG: hypothetical protein ACR2RF_32255 [Geminicoccaceae bacterium]
MTAVKATEPILQDDDNPWDDPFLRRRIGRFRISGSAEVQIGLRNLHTLQSTCIIRWMETVWDKDESTVYALNPIFDVVPMGNLIPWYHLIIEDEGDGVMSFRFERVENQELYGEPRA